MDLLQAVFDNDAETSAAAIERLCQVAATDGVLLAALGGHPSLLPHLRSLLTQPVMQQPDLAAQAAERLRMGAAFLISQMAGKTAAIDARLLDLRFVPALAAAAAAPAGERRDGWGRRRGALRAISKLLAAQPACAAAQLAPGGGVGLIAGLMDADDADQVPGSAGVVARRCLSILRAVAQVMPLAQLLSPAATAALVRVLAGRYRGSASDSEIQQEAAALVLLLAREPEAACQLAAAGAGPVLSSLAFSGFPAASRLAEQALQLLQGQQGWQNNQPAPALPAAAAAALQVLMPHVAAQRSSSSAAALPKAFAVGTGGPGTAVSTEMHRVASAPSQLPPPPEQHGAARGLRQQFSHTRSLTSQVSGATVDSLSRVQEWQQQLTEPGSTRHPLAPSPVSSGGGGGGGGTGHASVALLVSSLRSGFSRTRLAAAEQLAALAASSSRAAAVITAAGGGAALAACVRESAAGPVTIQDTLSDAFEEAVREGMCTAALRALCTLCQQAPSAAAALPAALPALDLLLQGPDRQQRQLAAMLLASAQEREGAAAQQGRQGELPTRQAEHAAAAGEGQVTAARLQPPPDLHLPSSSTLSQESEPGSASAGGSQQQTTPSIAVAGRRRPSPATPPCGGSSLASGSFDRPPRPLVIGGSSIAGCGGAEEALRQLPSKARRQLAQLLRAELPPPSAASPASSPPPGPADRLHRSRSAAASLSGGDLPVPLWATCSLASDELAAAVPTAAAGPPAGPGREAGSSAAAAAAAAAGEEHPAGQAAGSGSGGSHALIQRSEIHICQDPSGRDWKLGEGGFGVVLKGLMNGVDEVAVKCIKAETPSEADLAAFRREVHLLASLRHRNIVQYYGACLEPGSLFFVTELMKGGDLYTALRRHPAALAWDRLGRRVALDVALGLNYLHTRRPAMTHRDLKSPNILLSEEGVAKIGDVGMVRPQVSDLVTAQPLMTPLWAAPEVLRRERAGVKADMWSYGLLVWELVSGGDIVERQPLAISRTMAAQHRQAAGQAAVPVVEMCEGAPPVAAHIFAACTQLDPSLRPNAQQVVEWLRGSD